MGVQLNEDEQEDSEDEVTEKTAMNISIQCEDSTYFDNTISLDQSVDQTDANDTKIMQISDHQISTDQTFSTPNSIEEEPEEPAEQQSLSVEPISDAFATYFETRQSSDSDLPNKSTLQRELKELDRTYRGRVTDKNYHDRLEMRNILLSQRENENSVDTNNVTTNEMETSEVFEQSQQTVNDNETSLNNSSLGEMNSNLEVTLRDIEAQNEMVVEEEDEDKESNLTTSSRPTRSSTRRSTAISRKNKDSRTKNKPKTPRRRRNPSLESKTSMAASIMSTTTNKMSEISNLEIDMPVDLASDQQTMEQMDVLQRRYKELEPSWRGRVTNNTYQKHFAALNEKYGKLDASNLDFRPLSTSNTSQSSSVKSVIENTRQSSRKNKNKKNLSKNSKVTERPEK